jgi:cyclopropane-fatty-acyl-phospholipid synthase
MWDFYLAGAEAGFRVGTSVIYQFQLAKRFDALPITRDYISDVDRAAREPARVAAE